MERKNKNFGMEVTQGHSFLPHVSLDKKTFLVSLSAPHFFNATLAISLFRTMKIFFDVRGS